MTDTSDDPLTVRLLLRILSSFRRELPEHVFDTLTVCVGPKTYNHLATQGHTFASIIDMMAAVEEGAPEGAVGKLAGLWLFRVFDAGPDAAFVMLGPPPPWDRATPIMRLDDQRFA